MASTSPGSGLLDQQVMSAQSTNNPPQGVDGAVARMEGETAGPDYAGQRAVRPQLPNGVLRASPKSSPEVDIQSLPYSPLRPAGVDGQAGFLGEVWPTQPEPHGAARNENRNIEELPAAVRWMHRLGDFLRQHTAMEFTTTTRRQIVGSSASGSGFMVQQQVQHTASHPHTPVADSQTAREDLSGSGPAYADADPPLFGRGALRAMESWPKQAPLLHGASKGSAATDDASSASIPRELVEAEVRRQVKEALQNQQRGLDELRAENQQLKTQLMAGDGAYLQHQGVPEGNRAQQHTSHGVLGGDRASLQPHDVPEGNRAQQHTSHGVLGGDRALLQPQPVPRSDRAYLQDQDVPEGNRAQQHTSHGVLGGDRALLQPQPVPRSDRAYLQDQDVPEGNRAQQHTSLGVLGGDRASLQPQDVPGGNRAQQHTSYDVLGGDRAPLHSQDVPRSDRAYLQDSEVPEGTRAQHTSRGVLGGDRVPIQGTEQPAEDRAQQSTSRGVLGSGRAYFEYNGVNNGTRAQHTSRGVLGGDRVPFSFDEVDAQDPSGLRGSPQRPRQWDSRYGRPVSRSASPEPKPRIASGCPGRYGRSGSAQGFLRGRYLRRNADELLGGLSDGDLYGVRPTEMPYSAGPAETGPTFGDYDVGHPPGLVVTNRVPPERAEAQLPPTTASSPSPLDVLITGMSQLQQVLLKQKTGDAMDLEVKGVQELPKLPEYTPETGATDFQDYLYLTEQQVGSLASGAAEWWQKTLSVAQKAYGEYQSLSPMKRLSVRAVLPEELKEDKYKKLERKVASLVLSSLPKGVRDELVAHRVQGLRQILFRLMVAFQPGGAQDRAQLLRQLDVSESSPGPAEAVVALRRWYRLLQRAADLNIALPDESLQVRSLTNIVRRTAELHGDFKFRVALAKTELQIDSRPSQANVMRFLQHLLAELEQLGPGTKKAAAGAGTAMAASATTTMPTATTALKGVQSSADPTGQAKPKPKPGAPSPKKNCQWFEGGCRNGKQCTFVHSWQGLNRGERCLLCGSKQHRAKDCGTRDLSSPERPPPPPPRPTVAAATSSTTTTPAIAASPAKATPAVSISGAT